MRWDFVTEHWKARLEADPALRSVMGADSGFIYPVQSLRVVRVPSIEFQTDSDADGELWNRFTLRVDVFAQGRKAIQAERRVRILTHSDVAQELGGERLWMRFDDSRSVPYGGPEKNVVHRSIDFFCEVTREKYINV